MVPRFNVVQVTTPKFRDGDGALRGLLDPFLRGVAIVVRRQIPFLLLLTQHGDFFRGLLFGPPFARAVRPPILTFSFPFFFWVAWSRSPSAQKGTIAARSAVFRCSRVGLTVRLPRGTNNLRFPHLMDYETCLFRLYPLGRRITGHLSRSHLRLGLFGVMERPALCATPSGSRGRSWVRARSPGPVRGQATIPYGPRLRLSFLFQQRAVWGVFFLSARRCCQVGHNLESTPAARSPSYNLIALVAKAYFLLADELGPISFSPSLFER